MRKISDLNTDEVLDALCECSGYVANIAADEKLLQTIGEKLDVRNMTRAGVMVLGAEKATKIVPIVLKDHRCDVYGIVAAINGVPVEEIAAQNGIKTAVQIREICKDKELLDFFRSCVQPESNE